MHQGFTVLRGAVSPQLVAAARRRVATGRVGLGQVHGPHGAGPSRAT